MARRQAEKEARQAGHETDEALLAQGDPGYGYRKTELPLVRALRETRARWRRMGADVEAIVHRESQAWTDRYNKKFQVTEIVDEYDKEKKQTVKRVNVLVAEPANDYRIVRAFGGSSLDKGVKYHEEFDLPGEFSIYKLIELIEQKIAALGQKDRAPGA